MEVAPGLHWVDRIWDVKVYILLEPTRTIVIDAAMPGRERAIWQHLATLGRSPEAVDEIWLTHGDIDHMGSAAALKQRSGARIVVHQADAPLVEGQKERELGPVPGSEFLQRAFNGFIRHVFRYQPVHVDRAVTDGQMLGDWQVVHVPGHTPGSVCYYHPSRRIAIVGDALNYKRGQLGAPPRIVAPDPARAHASIRRIADLDFQVCCFGHGAPLKENARQRVRAFADSLPT